MGLDSKKLNDLAASINTKVDETTDTQPDKFLEKFTEFWPLVRSILKAVKIITGKRVDQAIDTFIAFGNDLTDDGVVENETVEKFSEHWVVIKPVLEKVTILTGAKIDKVIKEFIKLGDLIADEDLSEVESNTLASTQS